MSKKDGILNLPLTKHWFDEIKSGRKTHEYREARDYWNRILSADYEARHNYDDRPIQYHLVRFQLGYQKNAPKMIFEIKDISTVWGENTDLKIKGYVYDIELGGRIK